MKRILSILLSVVLTFSLFSTVGFAANESVTDAEVELFKNYLTENNFSFDENHYFFADFSDANGSTEYFMFEISTNKEALLDVAMAFVDNNTVSLKETVELNSDGSANFETSETVVRTISNTPIQVASTYTIMTAFPTKVGFALQNPSALKEDTEVKVALYKATVDADYKITKGDLVVEKTGVFNAPITFENVKYAKIGNVLTTLSQSKDVDYQTVVDALNDMADATEVTTEDKEKLDGHLTEEVISKLASVVTDNNAEITVAGKTNGVYIPYAALAQKIEGKVEYAPVVKEADEGYTVKDLAENAEKHAINISLSANGNEVQPVVKQKVVVDIPSTFDLSYTVDVYHKDTKIDSSLDKTARTVSFWVDSFSNFMLVGTPATESESNKAEIVQFKLIQNENEANKFSLVIAPAYDNQEWQITRFATAAMEYMFSVQDITDGAIENFTYDIEPAEDGSISISNIEDIVSTDENIAGGFKLIATATDAENLITVGKGQSIKIADLTITGNGKFKVNTASAELNDQNIYTETLKDNEAIPVPVHGWTSEIMDIPVEEKELKITVDFGHNIVKSTDAAYLGMKITLEGSISKEEKVLKVGEDLTLEPDDVNKTLKATGTIKLPAKETYTFVIEGKGYRTYRDSVYLDANKEIYLWNNAKDDTTNVIIGDDSTAKNVTFLVGDIYMDGKVDVYDLSAVTSYYDPDRAITMDVDGNYDKYIPYDLNRDGKISLTDIAYVQVSYGN